MAFGLKALNSATGSTQIDETYYNLVLVSKQTVTTADNGFGQRVATFNVTSSDTPVVGFSCSSDFAYFDGVSKSGSTWTFRVGVISTANRSITIYVFGRATTGASGYGIKVLNASSSLTFAGGNKYLKVASILAGKYGTPTIGPGDPGGASYGNVNLPGATLTSGRAYCVLCSMTAHYVWNEGSGQGYELFCMGVNIASNVLSSANLMHSSGYGSNYITTAHIDRREYNLIVCDVTNF